MPDRQHTAETPWTRQRDEWVRRADPRIVLDVIARVTANHHLDETGGDHRERIETILWLATRGSRGREWGQAGAAAHDGGWWSDDA